MVLFFTQSIVFVLSSIFFTMVFIDLVFAILLGFAVYKGFKNGFFVEVASFLGLLVGIYFALKFSNWAGGVFSEFVPTWNANYIKITAFVITFLLVVIGIPLSAKIITKMADFAFLGWFNKLAGGVFCVMKTILALSIVLIIVEKINYDNLLISREKKEHSIFYKPIQNSSKLIYPKLEGWYTGLKSEIKSEG
jgi:membrane protein required for colicin V production